MPKLFNFCGSPRYIFDLIRHIQSLDSNRYYSSGGNKKIPNRSYITSSVRFFLVACKMDKDFFLESKWKQKHEKSKVAIVRKLCM